MILKRSLQRREKSYPKGKGGKLMLARMAVTQQKMEMPKQSQKAEGAGQAK